MLAHVIFGDSEGERLQLEALGYAYPNATDTHDKNWINTQATIQSGRFRGNFSLFLQTTDFLSLLEQLQQVHALKVTTFLFQTLEEQLTFSGELKNNGTLPIAGKAFDEAGSNNCLVFSLEIDQSYLPTIISQLRHITHNFPFL